MKEKKKNRIRNKGAAEAPISLGNFMLYEAAQALGRRQDVEVLLTPALPSFPSSESINFSLPPFLPPSLLASLSNSATPFVFHCWPFFFWSSPSLPLPFNSLSHKIASINRFASDTFLYINSV